MKTIVLLITLFAFTGCASSSKVAQSSDNLFWLYVIQSEQGHIGDGRIYFEKTGKNLLYFSDRPNRLAGKAPIETLSKKWAHGENNFAENPPNAVLVTSGSHEKSETVIELLDVELEQQRISFRYKVILGELPSSFGENSLFIDSRSSTCPSWGSASDTPRPLISPYEAASH